MQEKTVRLSHEVLKAILVPTPPEEDRRGFLVRLFGSLKVSAKIKRSDAGKASVSIGVRGGTDF
jgi:hypothetical protein